MPPSLPPSSQRPIVYCGQIQDYRNAATCNTVDPLTWASLVIAFIAVQLSWWIFELLLLWKKNRPAGDDTNPGSKAQKGGCKAFLHAVTWVCIRANAHGSAAILSLYRGTDTAAARTKTLASTSHAAPVSVLGRNLYPIRKDNPISAVGSDGYTQTAYYQIPAVYRSDTPSRRSQQDSAHLSRCK
ncbi:hypothetical protein VTI74DRAFT_5569 [Chaetomium olivicolor]